MILNARAAQIQSLKKELNDVSERAVELFNGKSNDQLMRKPGETGWSAAECLAHLDVTGTKTLDEIDAAIAKARRESIHSNAEYKLDFTGRIFVKLLEPPVRFKVAAPPAFLFDAPTSGVAALEGFLRTQQRALEAIEAAGGISMVNVDVTSPASEYIKYNLYSAFRIMAAHERRHFLQAGKALTS